MLKKYRVLIGFIAIFSMSCTNDSVDDLLNDIDLTTVTYTNDVKSIIDNNCIVCHSSPPQFGAPMSLTSFDAVKTFTLNGLIPDRISRPQGASGMMPSGGNRLPQQVIDLIIEWKNQGCPE